MPGAQKNTNCMFICYARGSAGLSIAPAGAEVTNVAGVAGFLSGSIVLRGAVSCRAELVVSSMPTGILNRRDWIRQRRGSGLGDGPGGRVCGMEPSTISGFSVDGSALDIEPSMMRGVFVEGSTLRNGTFHGFGLQRGWFRSGC